MATTEPFVLIELAASPGRARHLSDEPAVVEATNGQSTPVVSGEYLSPARHQELLLVQRYRTALVPA
ncbi:hypothetical protein ACIRPX_17925 [Streptomyces sp. NPDC101225]|uniref:hypothetical protein n=1 Tax=Streptomyces sp. NPDC101225 TaxID=3366135 RepID=UPI0037F99B59